MNFLYFSKLLRASNSLIARYGTRNAGRLLASVCVCSCWLLGVGPAFARFGLRVRHDCVRRVQIHEHLQTMGLIIPILAWNIRINSPQLT